MLDYVAMYVRTRQNWSDIIQYTHIYVALTSDTKDVPYKKFSYHHTRKMLAVSWGKPEACHHAIGM